MAFLVSAAYHSNSSDVSLFTDAADTLLAHGYAVNIMTQTITSPTEINFSDNDLAFKPIYTMAAGCGWGAFNGTRTGKLGTLCNTLLPFFRHSIDRTMQIISSLKVPLYNTIYGITAGRSGSTPRSSWLGDAVTTLKEYPLELIRWPTNNSLRLDLPSDPALLPAINRSIKVQPASLTPNQICSSMLPSTHAHPCCHRHMLDRPSRDTNQPL
jgi:hypothetical protein